MRLLQVIPVYDGYNSFLRELTAELVAMGHEVLTMCNCEQRLLPYPIDRSFPLHHLAFPRGSSTLKQLSAARQLKAVVASYRPDVIHAHFSAGVLAAALARFIGASSAATSWLGTFQGLQFPLTSGLNQHLVRSAEAFAASRMDVAWVLTEDDQRALRIAAPKARTRLQQSLGFGCRDRYHDAPPPTAAERICLRADLGLDESDIACLFVGRMVAFKGFATAARGFLLAHNERPELHWLIVGDRDPLHASGLSDCEWQALRIHPNVHFLGTKPDVMPFYDAADALLFPSTREGMSVCIMEALARRLPVLTNRARGCKDLIEDGKNGMLFVSNTPEAVRDQLLAFTPFRTPPPDPLTRRSEWIREMISFYTSCSS